MDNGAYLVPVVWNSRLLIFFPQFMKKTSAKIPSRRQKKTLGACKRMPVETNTATELWEIKMAWSEYRNAKWTQKQVSADAIYRLSNSEHYLDEYGELQPPPFPLNLFRFTPRIVTGADPKVVVESWRGNQLAGSSLLLGAKYLQKTLISGSIALPEATYFHVYQTSRHALAAGDGRGATDPDE